MTDGCIDDWIDGLAGAITDDLLRSFTPGVVKLEEFIKQFDQMLVIAVSGRNPIG